jgi:hypothetical protein
MQNVNASSALRRSARVPFATAIQVTSLEPSTKFSEICQTLVVNAHGCALRSPVKFESGAPLHFRSKDGREITGHVVACLPMENDGWKLGVTLERPDNFWGMRPYPEEWDRVIQMPSPASSGARKHVPANGGAAKASRSAVPPALQNAFDKIEKQLSDEHLKSLLAQLVRPLNAEILELRDKLNKSARQNKFEVSLSQIPPELEEQLWARLHQNLSVQALQQAQEQGRKVFGDATAAIDRKVSSTLEEFRSRLADNLQAVEQRAKMLSQEMVESTQQQHRSEVEKFQQRVLDAGSSLDRRSETLLHTLQQNLQDDYHSYRREISQVQSESEARAAHIEEQMGGLEGRTSKLNESVRKLETDLDAHLERLSAEIISSARAELQNAAGAILQTLQVRGTQDLEARVADACVRLKTAEAEVEAAAVRILQASAEESVQAFNETMEQMAEHSVGRWRLALSRDLASVAATLSQNIRSGAVGDSEES